MRWKSAWLNWRNACHPPEQVAACKKLTMEGRHVSYSPFPRQHWRVCTDRYG